MKANSFQDKEAETEGKDVIPNKMAKTKDKTPEKDDCFFLSWLDLDLALAGLLGTNSN